MVMLPHLIGKDLPKWMEFDPKKKCTLPIKNEVVNVRITYI